MDRFERGLDIIDSVSDYARGIEAANQSLRSISTHNEEDQTELLLGAIVTLGLTAILFRKAVRQWQAFIALRNQSRE